MPIDCKATAITLGFYECAQGAGDPVDIATQYDSARRPMSKYRIIVRRPEQR